MRYTLTIAASLALLGPQLVAQPPVGLCGTCALGVRSPTIRDDVKVASVVLVGTLSNPRQSDNPNDDSGPGATTFHVRTVLKDHAVRANRTTLTIPRAVPIDPKRETLFLVFGDIDQGRIDFYRGVPLPGEGTVPYLKELVALNGRGVDERARFFFAHVDSPDQTVAGDAFQELSEIDWPDLLRLAPQLDRLKLRRLLAVREAPSRRIEVFATLLGAAGNPADAKALTDLLGRANLPPAAMTGAHVGLILLDKPAGWSRLNALLRDPRREFSDRYAGQKAVRFLATHCPAVASRDELAAALDPLLDQPDITDLAIEDLRRWGRWEMTDHVLALYGRGGFDIPIVKRAVLRFALSCPERSPGKAKAVALVKALRDQDAERVADAEELLRLEQKEPGGNGAPQP